MKNVKKNKVDKNKKYTFEEMKDAALQMYASKMDETLFEIVCVISCIVTHIMQDTEWETADGTTYRHTDKDIAVFHEELDKYISDWEEGKFSTIDVRDVYKNIYASCRKYLGKTRRSLAE